jgi:hypothetical protein
MIRLSWNAYGNANWVEVAIFLVAVFGLLLACRYLGYLYGDLSWVDTDSTITQELRAIRRRIVKKDLRSAWERIGKLLACCLMGGVLLFTASQQGPITLAGMLIGVALLAIILILVWGSWRDNKDRAGIVADMMAYDEKRLRTAWDGGGT